MAYVSDLLAAGRTCSFEFFPPKTDDAARALEETIAELAPLDPSFVSVTYRHHRDGASHLCWSHPCATRFIAR